MERIYNTDGNYKDYSDDEVEIITITSDNIHRLDNYKDGVNIYFKDGTVKFIDDAKTDGESVTFN